MSALAKTTTKADSSTQKFSPAHRGLLQRKCACGSSPGTSGMCEECHGKRLQRKLTIGASNDPLEAEADRVADQVLAAPKHPEASRAPLCIQRFTQQTTGGMDTAPASVDRVLASSGRPLEPALQQDMEQRFGHDFSRVRVHSGAAAEQSAREVNAHAYTVGHDVVFGAGRFVPGTHEGRRLVAHELTHVVQQSGRSNGIVQREIDRRTPQGTGEPSTEIEMRAEYVGSVAGVEPAERDRIRRRRQHTLTFFAKIKDYQLREAYVSRLQRYLDEGMEANLYWDFEMIEQIIQERAPNAPWHEAERQSFLAKRAAKQQSFLAKRAAKQQSEAREKQLPTLPSYWQNQFGALAEETSGWSEDARVYARGLLWIWRHQVAKFDATPYVHDLVLAGPAKTVVFNEIVKQYELELHNRDRAIQKECKGKKRGWLMNVWGDPCKPWFEGTSQRGEEELHQLQKRMRIEDEHGVPYRNIVFWLKVYMSLVNALPSEMGEVQREILGAWSTVQVAMTMAIKPIEEPSFPPASAPNPSRLGSAVRSGLEFAQASLDVAAMFDQNFSAPRIGHLVTGSGRSGTSEPTPASRPQAQVPPGAARAKVGDIISPQAKVALGPQRVIAVLPEGELLKPVLRMPPANRALPPATPTTSTIVKSPRPTAPVPTVSAPRVPSPPPPLRPAAQLALKPAPPKQLSNLSAADVKRQITSSQRDVRNLPNTNPNKQAVLGQLERLLKETAELEKKPGKTDISKELVKISRRDEELDDLVADAVAEASTSRRPAVAPAPQQNAPPPSKSQPPQLAGGQHYNDAHAFDYKYRELYVIDPKGGPPVRLDGYEPGKWIVSRKNQQLSEIPLSEAKGHVAEFAKKYAKGRLVAQVKSSGVQTGGAPATGGQKLSGTLQGEYVLEIPIQSKPVPVEVLAAAKSARVTIRDVAGNTYALP